MDRTDKKLFGCPVCGFRVSGTEDACPRCGTRYNKNTRFECPFCGEHVPAKATECPSCHVEYVEFYEKMDGRASDESIDDLLTEIISIEAEQVKQEGKRLSCPRCSWLLDGTEERCPKCGVGFLEDVSYQCPVCASMVPQDATQCQECGAKFVAEEPAPEAEPEPEMDEEPVPEEEPVEAGQAPQDEPGPTPEVAEAADEPPVEQEEAPAEETKPVEEPPEEVEKPPVRAPKRRKLKVKTPPPA